MDEVRRANLDGTNVESIVILVNVGQKILRLTHNIIKSIGLIHILSQISRANLDGSNAEDIVNVRREHSGIDLTVQGKIYWVDSNLDVIKRANIDGSNIETIVSLGNAFPEGIAVDDIHGKMYWVDSFLDKIQRANLDGSGIQTIVNLGNAVPVAVALAITEAYPQFPLEIGNRWDFVEGWWDGSGNSSEDTLVYRVISDTVLQNGKMYYKILPEGGLFKNLIRSDSTGFYYYDTECDSEWLFYSFDFPIGEPIKVPMYICDTTNSPIVYKTSEDSIIYFGNNVSSATFNYVGGVDNWYEITLTKEFGFTNWNSSDPLKNYYKSLVGCEVGGTVYGTLTNIKEEPTKLSIYSLKQNYPNPFNSITNIFFEIPDRQMVRLKVYDILGNLITELVNGEMDPGEHRIKFNSGGISSGVYIYQLQTKNNILSKKMIFLK